MYLYNVSVIVEESEGTAVRSLLVSQVEFARDSGLTVRLLELLDSPHEGITFSLQLEAANSDVVADFQTKHLALLHAKINDNHEGKVVYFDSLMQQIG